MQWVIQQIQLHGTLLPPKTQYDLLRPSFLVARIQFFEKNIFCNL